MKRLLLLLIAGAGSLCLSVAYAQIPKPPVNVQSPNTSSLGLYGEVPVSFFTGLPAIDISLYKFQEQGIELPITLNYHASGFRPDMHPGWVGMGWALDGGGMVSRIVKDVPDDYSNSNYAFGNHAGFFWNYGVLNATNWDQTAYMQSVARGDGMLLDTEPDEYSFSFPGGNGKFYLDHTGKWKVKCDRPVKVTFNNQFLAMPFPKPQGTRMELYDNTSSFSGFTITDEKGNRYVYGGNTNAIEYEIGMFSQYLEEWIAQSWYLTKIIHADGYEINLAYEKDNFVNQMYIAMSMDRGTSTVNSGNIFNPQPSCNSSSWGSSEYYYFNGKLVSPSYLRSVTGSHRKVFFDRSTSSELRYPSVAYEYQQWIWSQSGYGAEFIPCLSTDNVPYPQCLDKLQWKKLDQVRIEDLDGNLQKKFVFGYNNNAAERLRLLTLTETGSDGKTKPPHQFFYDVSQPLPPYLAAKTDHWGFYNGTYADVSNQNTFVSTYYGYREPNSTYMLTGSMNKMIYPTGGVTEFTYEPHRYSKRLQANRTLGLDASFNTNTMAGGLRIKKVTSYDVATPSVKKTKEYFYVNGYTNTANTDALPSSGILGGQVQYYFDDYRTSAFNDNGIVYSKKLFSSQSVLPACNNSMGSHIGYSEVTEKLSDGSYTRYFYTNFDNGHIDEAVPCLQITRTPYEPGTSLEAERGLPLKEWYYNAANTLVKKREIEYTALNKTNEYARGMMARYFNVCSNTAVSVEEGTAYRNYTYSYLPSQETITQYDTEGNNPVATVRNISYNAQYRQADKEYTTNSKGETVTSYYRYPYDVLGYTPAANVATTQTTAYMVQNNYIGVPVEVVNTKLVSGVETVVKSQLTRYQSFNGRIKPAVEYQLAAEGAVPKTGYSNYMVTGFSTSEAVTMDSRLQAAQNFTAYTTRGNVSGYAKNNDYNNSYIWGYGDQFCVAEVTNAAPGQVAYTSFEEGDLGGWTSVTGSSILTSNGNVSGVKSFSGTLSRTMLTAGTYILTLWGTSGGTQTVNGAAGEVLKTTGGKALKQWRLVNPSTITIAGDNIDEVRLYPENAQMVTYAYDPLKGMTARCDANNLFTHYSYDAFGRLEMVRDHDKNLMKKMVYNYRDNPGIVYYNKAYSYTYTKKCFGLGSMVDYVVPAGLYSSVVSQQEADARAYLDAQEKGQIYADINGTCDVSPLSFKYVKSGTSTITVSCENVYTHRLYNFSFNAAVTAPAVFGSMPKGYYNVTITSTDPGYHAFGLGIAWQDANAPSATFLNARMLYEIDFLVIVNGN